MVDLTSETSISVLSWLMLIMGPVTASFLLSGIQAMYGRYATDGMLSISARPGWMIQEFPSFALAVLGLMQAQSTGGAFVIFLFMVHYVNRTFIYPFQLSNPKPSPIIIVATAILFTTWNGYIQGFHHAWYYDYAPGHFTSLVTVVGLFLFIAGAAINLHSDHILRNLRKPGETGYKIPKGGMFEYVSGANFLGECVEWLGYALVARSLPAVAFAVYTVSNIGPRALHHHQWYLAKFKDYPNNRKALIPFVL